MWPRFPAELRGALDIDPNAPSSYPKERMTPVHIRAVLLTSRPSLNLSSSSYNGLNARGWQFLNHGMCPYLSGCHRPFQSIYYAIMHTYLYITRPDLLSRIALTWPCHIATLLHPYLGDINHGIPLRNAKHALRGRDRLKVNSDPLMNDQTQDCSGIVVNNLQ